MEVVSEETAVAVREVLASLESDIWHLSDFSMDLVVLSVGGVEVGSSEFISSVFTNDFLENPHSNEVGVSEFGGVEENSNVNVRHFIVSHVQHGGSEEGLFSVGDDGASWGFTWDFSEVLFTSTDEAFVVDTACSDDEEVLASEVGGVEVLDVVFSDVCDVLADTEHGLTDEVVSERCVVGGFSGGSFLVLVVFHTFCVHQVSLSLDLVFIVQGVLENVSQESDGLVNLILLECQGISCAFTLGADGNLATETG